MTRHFVIIFVVKQDKPRDRNIKDINLLRPPSTKAEMSKSTEMSCVKVHLYCTLTLPFVVSDLFYRACRARSANTYMLCALQCTTITLFETFPKRQILDSSKLKEFADDNFEVDENGRKLS